VFCPARNDQARKGKIVGLPGSALTVSPGTLDFKQQTAKWPNRAVCPPICDIVGYRQSLPPGVPASKIGDLAQSRFSWTDGKTISSCRYVQGVVAGYDSGRNSEYEELHEYLRDGPEPNPSAEQRTEWVRDWVANEPQSSESSKDFLD